MFMWSFGALNTRHAQANRTRRGQPAGHIAESWQANSGPTLKILVARGGLVLVFEICFVYWFGERNRVVDQVAH